MSASSPRPGLRARLARRGLDTTTLLAVPAIVLMLGLFVYPFLYGLGLSLMPRKGSLLSNYVAFFTTPYLYGTIATTLWIALPVSILGVVVALPIALRVRHAHRQRLLTTLMLVPATLGVVLVAEGMLNYLGPRGWLNRALIAAGITTQPLALIHNYWGVFISLFITGFPFTFLLTLSYLGGIDPALERAGAMLGARAGMRFRRILLPLLLPGLTITFALAFVYAFSVFPSAILVGAPDGATRVISIAAYEAAFEDFDYSRGAAIAIIMAAAQAIVVLALLAARRLAYRGATGLGKG